MIDNPHLVKHYKIEGGLGMLMYGAPGTGKTMFAEAIANKMGLPLFIITPSDIFKSYVGESEAAVKQLFEEIDACPEGAVVFIDECESIFAARKSDDKSYKSAVTTELLQRINGFGVDGSRRVMIAATNRPEMINKAYLRHKRFSHLVHVTPPDDTAKEAIIRSKLEGIDLEGDREETIKKIIRMASGKKMEYSETVGGEVERVVGYYSGADISGIVEEACRLALEQLEKNQQTKPIPLTLEMFKKAFAKIPPSISPSLLEEYENFRDKMSE
jgi:SpoVK/Ycf46/Vps4 family AAA+-type ATPase